MSDDPVVAVMLDCVRAAAANAANRAAEHRNRAMQWQEEADMLAHVGLALPSMPPAKRAALLPVIFETADVFRTERLRALIAPPPAEAAS
jgi:hypothetical protein